MHLWDVHTHSRVGSACSTEDPCNLVRRAKELNLEGLCITDHVYSDSRQDGGRDYTSATELARSLGIGLIIGNEVTCYCGSEFLVYLPDGSRLDGAEFGRFQISTVALSDRIHALGGAVVRAHPYDVRDAPLSAVDGVEVLNGMRDVSGSPIAVPEGAEVALLAGSDAHFARHMGCFATEFHTEINDAPALVREIRQRRCSPHIFHAGI